MTPSARLLTSPHLQRQARNHDSNPSIFDCGVTLEAKLDTGSDLCVFNRIYADLLNLELESGTAQSIRTASGSFLTYGHELKISVKDLEWEATVYFAEPADFPVNVVGRKGFLDHLRLGVIDYDQVLYLADYNS